MKDFCLWVLKAAVIIAAVLAIPIVRTYSQSGSPGVAGVSLEMSPQSVSAVLGAPEVEEASLGMRFWEYRTRGITVIWRDDAPGVRAIVLSKRTAGDIRGVRVGDTKSAISTNWGLPVRVRGAGRFLDFAGRQWTLSAEIAKGKAVEITLLAAR
ncbi:MAG TPA: hypothetical protein VF962_13560 [Gemmatimonadaceae bacterium]